MSDTTPGCSPWVALVGPEVEENLALRYLAAALSAAGVEARILPFDRPEQLGALAGELAAAESPPALVALSLAFQGRAMEFLGLAVALRRAGYRGHLTAGGHFGAFAFREVLRDFPELDSLCLHEAEETLVALVRSVQAGSPLAEVAGLACRGPQGEVMVTARRPPPDLSRLPWPDRRGEPARCLGHGIAPLIASRGCYGDCSFCCIAAWHRQAGAPRFRLRPVEDVADEMAHLHRTRGIDIFLFHDDNFFLPGARQSLERIHALADGLRARGVSRFATIVKARPTDLEDEVVGALSERLGCIRCFLGVETNSTQGLLTLQRRVAPGQNEAALEALARHGIYTCFNLLIFDPDTTLEDLEANLAFLEAHSRVSQNFGRVELYAGTPLLARMQREGRCRGDYLGFGYRLARPELQRIFELAARCFYPRNHAPDALVNRLAGTRLMLEVAAFFHPGLCDPAWRAEGVELRRWLALDSVAGLRRIVGCVTREGQARQEEFARELEVDLRRVEREVLARTVALEQRVQAGILTTGQPRLARSGT
jgi:anaerobic magnesium-protoporphyrin IX monomethyl ester cyclase